LLEKSALTYTLVVNEKYFMWTDAAPTRNSGTNGAGADVCAGRPSQSQTMDTMVARNKNAMIGMKTGIGLALPPG
jgi:hypothetical protein